ncbi:mitochondrial peptidyl-tRNA hydrolase [Cordyceps fumosorosea ARSEF 2679]|uniref:peptidyl-tRNA hydrolase n=1 Tax=Cordyceps fumosorosea (strain ARSEF 2679) TaxID=1081104 RepID=A0A167LDA9_CORFA|nr:mitochondrial peptidyl-tRNA hydrolase [Cordyceps fumosorosea ARSEF 2679]OAA52952.1 mitochondrial peptidyl-tRNA hydrolase [Cordyceps fumosorosea ARSEF 2679]
MSKFNPKFLIVSLGNPLPEYSSLHSAGHFALRGLAKPLRQPGLRSGKLGKLSCLVSPGPKYTLVQSPTLMNVSGPFVARAWQEMLKLHDAASLSLVVLHDELEKALGRAALVPWDRSPRGHNGIKSVKQALREDRYPRSPLVRIAVGIDRPQARDPATVARYVLDPIPAAKQRVLEEEVPWEVKTLLEELEAEWKGQVEG